VAFIYHIATVADWALARREGEYTMSSRGRTLAEEGFIHASSAGQVAWVANSFYAGVPDLLLLVIDTGKLGSLLRYDPVPGWDEPFPHIYGPLRLDAVVKTMPLEPGPDGVFTFTLPSSGL
jgi:uncharacterized protein (DUF952 family)